MNVYMISYDLNSPTNNRQKIEESIKSLGISCKYISTTFLVKTAKNIYDVKKVATKYLDGNDKMVICKVQKPIAGLLEQNQWDWINANL